jgi:hypothetical protein
MTPEYQREWRRTSPKYDAQRTKTKERVRLYKLHFPEKVRETTRRSNKKHANKRRNARLMAKFGIGIEEYDAMLAAQGGHCAICAAVPIGRSRRFPVDHDHATGKIRGILCPAHNRSIGALGDNEAGLQIAMDYVKGTLCLTPRLLPSKPDLLPPR